MFALQVRSASWSARSYDVVGARLAVIKGDERFGIKVSGTSRHQEELELAAGERRPDSAHQRCAALLLPEPDNRHDANAVGVVIEGMQVGHLQHHQAPFFGQSLQQRGCVAAICAAEVVSGLDQGDADVGHFGVRLNAFLPLEIERTVIVEADGKIISAPSAATIEDEIAMLLTPDQAIPQPSDVVPFKAPPVAASRKPIGAGHWWTLGLSILTIATVMTLVRVGYAPKDQSNAGSELAAAVRLKGSDGQTEFMPIPSRDIFRTKFSNAFSKE